MITTSQAKKRFGSIKKVAEFFDVEASAVYQWGRDLPLERQYELMMRLPDEFPPRLIPNKKHAKKRRSSLSARG